MRLPVTGNLAALDRVTATQRYSDRRNLGVLYLCAVLLLIEGIVALTRGSSDARAPWLGAAFGLFALSFLLIRICTKLRRPPSEWKPRGATELAVLGRLDSSLRTFVIATFLTVAGIVTVRWIFPSDDHPLLVLIAIAIALRVTFNERLMIHLAMLLAAIAVMTFRSEEIPGGSVFLYAVLSGVALLVGWLLTRGFVRSFLRQWEPEQRRLLEEVRMREELDLARTIQLSMLPRRIPDVPGLSLAARSIPATEVGGDFYDFFECNGRFAVVAADVAGHGVASGIVLSGVRTALRLLSEHLEDPERMIARLEKIIRETRTERMLVTLSLVSIAPDRKTATVMSAGHPPVLHARGDGTADVIMLPSLPLGTGLVQPCRSAELRLAPGDRILVHSDGVYETRDPHGEEFGLERLRELVSGGDAGESPDETTRRIVEALGQFRGGSPQEDDVTLVALRVD